MNTISLHLAVHFHCNSRWNEIKRQFTECWYCARSRHELESLDERCLQDIGMSRCTAERPSRFGCPNPTYACRVAALMSPAGTFAEMNCFREVR